MQSVPLLDAHQLNRKTMGDPALQVEVLSLFATEAERLMRQVEDAPDAQIRADRLRAMIALARNTGAARLAHVARDLEREIVTEELDLQPLRATLSETLAYVSRARL